METTDVGAAVPQNAPQNEPQAEGVPEFAEVPEEAGAALKFIGSEITRLGSLLEALAARMDKLDKPAQ